MSLYSIGEFSKISGLTVKTLRFYHEKNILTPDYVDEITGYRYYRSEAIAVAKLIKTLKSLDFSLAQIQDLVSPNLTETMIQNILVKEEKNIKAKIRLLKETQKQVQFQISQLLNEDFTRQNEEIQIKETQETLFAFIRKQADYTEIGSLFRDVAQKANFSICGKPVALFFDYEYQNPGTYEAGFPVKRSIENKMINTKILPQCSVVCTVHKGPYHLIGDTYARLINWLKDNNKTMEVPTREIYFKGPGLLFNSNPAKYLTEVQIPYNK